MLYQCIFFVIFVHICAYCSLVCIFFAAKSLSRSIKACMSMYAHIYKKYAHICTNIYNIHARYMQNTGITIVRGDVHIKKLILYLYVYVHIGIYCIYTCMYFLGSSYMTVSVHICIYLHIYACI